MNSTNHSPIVEGIASVGVGRKGSRDMSPGLVSAVVNDFKNNIPTRAQIGAFFAGLYQKGLAASEEKLEDIFPNPILSQPEQVFDFFIYSRPTQVPIAIRKIGVKLFHSEKLTLEEAYAMGKYVFAPKSDAFIAGVLASALRVRYETEDEYHGLLLAMEETVESPFRQPISSGPPIIQMAEPFDGVDRSYLLTPIIAEQLAKWGYRVVVMVGRSSGPKYGLTALDLLQKLGIEAKKQQKLKSLKLIKKTGDIDGSPGVFYLDQKNLSSALDKWVDIRREILKRPFLATLEKFINPFKASISLTSAFHGPYSEKMITIGEKAGFSGVIVIRRGPEGTLSFSSHHGTVINISKMINSTEAIYQREVFEYGPKEAGLPSEREKKIENLSPMQNAELVKNYFSTGSTGDVFWDNKIKITLGGLRLALKKIDLPHELSTHS